MTDNLDELKRQWQKISVSTDSLKETDMRLSDRLKASRIGSNQERLASRISRCSIPGLILPVLAPILHYELALPWWYCILYAAYGIVMTAVGLLFARYIRAVNLALLPVAESVERAIRIRSIQNYIQLAGFMLCFAILFVGAWVLPDYLRVEVLYGASAGMVIGLAIAIPRLVSNIRLSRQLLDSIRE